MVCFGPELHMWVPWGPHTHTHTHTHTCMHAHTYGCTHTHSHKFGGSQLNYKVNWLFYLMETSSRLWEIVCQLPRTIWWHILENNGNGPPTVFCFFLQQVVIVKRSNSIECANHSNAMCNLVYSSEICHLKPLHHAHCTMKVLPDLCCQKNYEIPFQDWLGWSPA